MKKLIQICSLLGLLVAFSFVSASAQSTIERYEANIPFDFTVSGQTYEAGNYTLGLSKATGGSIVRIKDAKNRTVQSFFVMERGDVAKKNSNLTFVRDNENQWTLAKIMTTQKGFSVVGAKAAKSTIANVDAGSDIKTVSIN